MCGIFNKQMPKILFTQIFREVNGIFLRLYINIQMKLK